MTAAWRYPGRGILTTLLLLGILSLWGCNEGDENSGDSPAPPGDTAPPGDPPPDDGGSGSGNTAPTITGTPPPSVKVGENYSFQPEASDPDGDTLTFSVQAKPAWASFDPATGILSGTPEVGDEGPYDAISIAVSDGSASDSLSFAVTVNQVAMGTVTLSWTPPTRNSDGSELTDLAGYKIYYGVAPGDYTEEIQLDNPGLSTYVVENLSPNTYYFVASAFNTEGVESNFSGVAEITVN